MDPKGDHEILSTQKIYDQDAASYAERFWDADLENSWEAFSGRLPENALVLDLGCGAGRDAAVFQQRGFRVVGADLSAGLLREAQARAPGNYTQTDMRHLPFQ